MNDYGWRERVCDAVLTIIVVCLGAVAVAGTFALWKAVL